MATQQMLDLVQLRALVLVLRVTNDTVHDLRFEIGFRLLEA